MEDHNFEQTIRRSKKGLFRYLLLVIALFAGVLYFYFQNVELKRKIEIANKHKVKINEENAGYVEELSKIKTLTDDKLDTLTNAIITVEKINDSLVDQLSKYESNTPKNEHLLNNTSISQIKNSKYLIRIESFNIPLNQRRKLEAYLKKQGYMNIEGFTHDDDGFPNWMNKKPTVLYYSKMSISKATAIAKVLSKITGKTFSTKMGNRGRGVIKGQESVTFTIHMAVL